VGETARRRGTATAHPQAAGSPAHVKRLWALAVLISAPAWQAQPIAAWRGERSEYVMGTMLTLSVESADSALGQAALDTAFATVHRLDRLLSNYRPKSEISQIAAQAPNAVAVSPETFHFLVQTLWWTNLSSGALNPAVGPLVECWGFNTESPKLPDSAALAGAMGLCDYRRIQLDSTSRSVRVDCGMRIDPGATGKGYALAVIDTVIARMGVTSLWADFGGQLLCRGTDTLLVPVRHPRSDTTAVAWLGIASGSVATSGDYDRFFEQDGVRYTHILDSRTGLPVQGRAAVSVYTPDPLAADALSTALFVRGPADASSLLKPARGGALFAEWDGDSLSFIIVGEWPEAP